MAASESLQLALEGITISSMGVRVVWSLHDLQTKRQRQMRLEEASRGKQIATGR